MDLIQNVKVDVDWTMPDGTVAHATHEGEVTGFHIGSWVSIGVSDGGKDADSITLYHYNADVVSHVVVRMTPKEGVSGGDINQFLSGLSKEENHG